jgi:hypothetical protein
MKAVQAGKAKSDLELVEHPTLALGVGLVPRIHDQEIAWRIGAGSER